MLTLLFWNVAGRPIEHRIGRIVAEHGVDVVLLAECATPKNVLAQACSSTTSSIFHVPFSTADSLATVTRLPTGSIIEIFCNPLGRLTVSRLVTPQFSMLVALVHFQSKLHWSGADQAAECGVLQRDIAAAEREYGLRRTVVVGDLNMNPFDEGVVSSHGLHAVMSKAIASKGSRIVAQNEYPYFYNPMWSVLGDVTPGPAGTFYHPRAAPICYFWNTFDQVLVRPELLQWFEGVRIIDHDGQNSLLTQGGHPDADNASDHLPILFRFNLP